MEEKHYALGFSLIPKAGPTAIIKIKNKFGTLEKAWQCKNASGFVMDGLRKTTAESIISEKNKIDIEKEINEIQQEKMSFISVFDDGYPPQLRQISCPPAILYYRGNIKLLKEKQLAVIGSRKLSAYGKQAIEKTVPDIVYAGMAITSGLAMGADSYAHQITLENNGKAIAVMGNGLSEKIIRSSFSYNLYNDILNQEGIVLSEFSPFFEASKFTFPARNRIISGLSLGTLIIEAAEKSGSLITAKYALQQNREVFAIPGNIFSPQSAGTNQLIKNGAKLVSGANDIFEELNFVSRQMPLDNEKNFEDEMEEKIYNFLTFEPTHIDKIAKKFSLSSSEASQKLSMMELKNFIRVVPGNKFVRN